MRTMKLEQLDADLQRAVKYLTRNPGKIENAWNWPHKTAAAIEAGGWNPGSVLFQFASPDGMQRMGADIGDVQPIGCLTQVRCGTLPADTRKLTLAIKADEKLPQDVYEIKKEHLLHFATWRHRLRRMKSKS